jgi:hypothetical protein
MCAMSSSATSSTRIFGVMARNAPRVVLIRRGPSKQVLLLTWNTLKHEFHAGQWLKGRIYEERCDLSPLGEKFIYLAAHHKAPPYAWTAVSRPPYLTALLMWPNLGTWGGGGLFEGERTIAINSHCGLTPSEGFVVPRDIRVVPIGRWMGRGEDDPIRSVRMKRDGWLLVDEGECTDHRFGERYRYEFTRPERWHKRLGPLTLERRLLGIGEQDGPWLARDHRVLDAEGEIVLDLGPSDWADWSHSGELLFARAGQVWRSAPVRGERMKEPEVLLDLRAMRFEQVPPPREALDWSARTRGRLVR